MSSSESWKTAGHSLKADLQPWESNPWKAVERGTKNAKGLLYKKISPNTTASFLFFSASPRVPAGLCESSTVELSLFSWFQRGVQTLKKTNVHSMQTEYPLMQTSSSLLPWLHFYVLPSFILFSLIKPAVISRLILKSNIIFYFVFLVSHFLVQTHLSSLGYNDYIQWLSGSQPLPGSGSCTTSLSSSSLPRSQDSYSPAPSLPLLPPPTSCPTWKTPPPAALSASQSTNKMSPFTKHMAKGFAGLVSSGSSCLLTWCKECFHTLIFKFCKHANVQEVELAHPRSLLSNTTSVHSGEPHEFTAPALHLTLPAQCCGYPVLLWFCFQLRATVPFLQATADARNSP